jgi:hypothetical protein
LSGFIFGIYFSPNRTDTPAQQRDDPIGLFLALHHDRTLILDDVDRLKMVFQVGREKKKRPPVGAGSRS